MRTLVPIVCSGLILANLTVSSSSTVGKFAPVPMTMDWLYVAAFVCGLALGITLDQASTIFYGVCSMAFIAVLIFCGVLITATLLSRTQVLDIILLFAFQQSFVRFVYICVLGFIGAVFSAFLKTFFGH